MCDADWSDVCNDRIAIATSVDSNSQDTSCNVLGVPNESCAHWTAYTFEMATYQLHAHKRAYNYILISYDATFFLFIERISKISLTRKIVALNTWRMRMVELFAERNANEYIFFCFYLRYEATNTWRFNIPINQTQMCNDMRTFNGYAFDFFAFFLSSFCWRWTDETREEWSIPIFFQQFSEMSTSAPCKMNVE